jgi:ribosomal protein S18 acetylase RimI-like enzyme
MESIIIRKVIQDELKDLITISRQTFYDTFSGVNSEENMRKYLDESLSEEKIQSELANENSEFYFAVLIQDKNSSKAKRMDDEIYTAEHEEQIIGYLKLNFGNAQTELKNDHAIEIERIYILKAFQGKKVGQLLYNKAIETAQERNAAFVWLGVWEENHKAINFYKKNGFIEFDQHKFVLGDDMQTDLMMKLELPY